MKALIRPKSGAFAWHANAVENCVVDSIFDGSGVSDIPGRLRHSVGSRHLHRPPESHG